MIEMEISREELIAFGEKVRTDQFKSDKPRTVENSLDEFLAIHSNELSERRALDSNEQVEKCSRCYGLLANDWPYTSDYCYLCGRLVRELHD